MRNVRSAAASTSAMTVAVATSGVHDQQRPHPRPVQRLPCQSADSAPTRASSRTSRHPERAAQQATLAPAPPGSVRIAGGRVRAVGERASRAGPRRP